MSSNYFDDNGDDFLDNPVSRNDGQWVADQGAPPRPAPLTDSQKKAIQAARAQEIVAQPTAAVQEEEFEVPELEEDFQEDYTEVLSDARYRLELGRLWEQIIKHDIFGGTDADPVAAKQVQNEIRTFAKERMEIMLGMRKETSQVERLEIDFPFNRVEVNVLKKLAHAASKGASENSDKFVPEVKRTTEEIPNITRKEGLNKIGSSNQKTQQKKLTPKSSVPVQRQKAAPVAQESAFNDPDADYEPLKKDPSQMSPSELIARNKAAVERQRGKQPVRTATALAQPTYEQTEMLARQHAGSVSPGMSKLIETVINLPKRQ